MADPLQELKRLLPGAKTDEPLSQYTTFKIGGPADLFYDAKNSQDLLNACIHARRLGVPIFILGGGSNILIGDKGIRGLVIKNSALSLSIVGMKGKVESGRSEGQVYVQADSGVPMNKLVRFTIEEGLSGLHMHLGLPGSVGGALYMNSKWTHPTGFVGDSVYQATIVTSMGSVKTVPRTYFQFAYDQSVLQKTKDIVLSVIFALGQSDKDTLWKTANESIAYRRETQPQGVLSAGCTFRNISESQALSIPTPNHVTSAGFLVDHAGLKGMVIGKAKISIEHANFITNLGGATARDVIKLIALAKEEVKRQFGVALEEEIVRVGEF